MKSQQWIMVLWAVALINLLFGFYKLTEGESESALIHFVLALLFGFVAWRRKQKGA